MACASPGSVAGRVPEGILRYTEAQTVATQRLLPFRPVLGMSEERYAKTLTLALRLLKRLHRP